MAKVPQESVFALGGNKDVLGGRSEGIRSWLFLKRWAEGAGCI